MQYTLFSSLVSTSGYVVVDDTNYPQFDDSEWPWVVNKTYPEPEPLVCGGYSKEQVGLLYT